MEPVPVEALLEVAWFVFVVVVFFPSLFEFSLMGFFSFSLAGQDFAKLMADMQKNGGGMGGMPDFGAGGDSDDEDEEEDVPELVSEEKEIEKVD